MKKQILLIHLIGTFFSFSKYMCNFFLEKKIREKPAWNVWTKCTSILKCHIHFKYQLITNLNYQRFLNCNSKYGFVLTQTTAKHIRNCILNENVLQVEEPKTLLNLKRESKNKKIFLWWQNIYTKGYRHKNASRPLLK